MTISRSLVEAMQSNLPQLGGVIAPVATPFDESGLPDAGKLVAFSHWLLSDGCSALAPFGTTSEANSLGLDERMRLLDALVEGGIDAGRLMPGTGTPAGPDTARLTRHAVSAGAAGVLMLPPYYFKGISDEGIFAAMARVIEWVGDDRLRVFLYHIPPIAQVGFSVPLVGRLIEAFPGIVVGLKDSSSDWNNTRTLIEAYGGTGFQIYSGSESHLLDNLRAGGVGSISASANFNARMMRRVYNGWRGEDADALQASLTAARKFMQAYPLIPLVKACIAAFAGDDAWRQPRPPLMAMPKEEAAKVIAELRRDYGVTPDIRLSDSA